MIKYLLLFGSLTAAVVGQLLLKQGVQISSLEPTLPSLLRTVFAPFIFSGLVMYGLSALIWLFVLQRFPLSVAYPAISLTYVAIVALSFLLFQEPFTFAKGLGILLIITGVYFLFQ